MITLNISDARLVAGATKQLAAYNADKAPEAQLTMAAYLLGTLPLNDWADRWAPSAIPTGEWLQRWTVEERKAARQLGTQNAQVQAWLDELDAHAEVHLSHPDIVQGVPAVCAALEQLGVIAAGQGTTRAAEIVAY